MPRLIRLYITQCLIGFAIAALFVAGFLWFDVARLGYLASHTDAGPFAVLVLWLHLGLVFAGVQFGISIMRLAAKDRSDD